MEMHKASLKEIKTDPLAHELATSERGPARISIASRRHTAITHQAHNYGDGLGCMVTVALPILVGSVPKVAVTITVAGFGTLRGAV
jgi:hypothetical protein